MEVRLEIENRGVAPFHYDWKAEYGLLAGGEPVWTTTATGQLMGLLPGDGRRLWVDTLDLTGIKAGAYMLAVRVPNPMKGGKPLRFANATQDTDAPGWLSLGTVQVR